MAQRRVRESSGWGAVGRTLQGEGTDRRAQREESQSRSQGSGRGEEGEGGLRGEGNKAKWLGEKETGIQAGRQRKKSPISKNSKPEVGQLVSNMTR